MPTAPDSILAILLGATADLHAATASANVEASYIDDELAQLPPGGFAYARSMLTERRAALTAATEQATRAIVAAAAARLSLRTGPDGECDIDKPAIRPKGPPTKAEKAAREVKADPPPTMQAGEPGAAADAFFATLSDRAPAAELEALGWTDETAAALSDVQSRVVVKHQIEPAEVTALVSNGVSVRGIFWTMSDDARVIA